MECIYQKEDKLLKFKLTEEIDHHLAEKIRRRADYEIQRYMPKRLYLILVTLTLWTVQG